MGCFDEGQKSMKVRNTGTELTNLDVNPSSATSIRSRKVHALHQDALAPPHWADGRVPSAPSQHTPTMYMV